MIKYSSNDFIFSWLHNKTKRGGVITLALKREFILLGCNTDGLISKIILEYESLDLSTSVAFIPLDWSLLFISDWLLRGLLNQYFLSTKHGAGKYIGLKKLYRYITRGILLRPSRVICISFFCAIWGSLCVNKRNESVWWAGSTWTNKKQHIKSWWYTLKNIGSMTRGDSFHVGCLFLAIACKLIMRLQP